MVESWLYTGGNNSTTRDSTRVFNTKVNTEAKLQDRSLNLPMDLGYGVVTGITEDTSGIPSGIKVLLTKRNNNPASTVSDPIVAFPLSKDLTKIPLINETVLCIRLPITLGPGDSEQWYYFSSINSFDNINNNLVGGVTYDRRGDYNGETFVSQVVPNMKLFEGDTLVQGRFGNTVRLSSTSVDNDWSVGGTSGHPITIISNGGGDLENLDDDPSSIYLTDDQSLPIYLQSPAPPTLQPPEQYSGTSQVVISSDKLVFYTKNGVGDIIISSLGTAYLMGTNIHLATNEWSNVDFTALMDIIEGLIDQLKDLTSGQAKFATGVGPTGPATNMSQVMKLKTDLALLKG